jgi:cbb3-type cytochrome oxidase subunit 3
LPKTPTRLPEEPLFLLFVAFVGIVIWVFGRKRKTSFAKDARIPFDDGKG